jgi:hypothetical protein
MTMAESDEPDLHEDYDISVRVPEDVDSDGVHDYLRRLAENINESEDVAVDHDDSTSLRRDSAGLWADATMIVYLGCGTKKGDQADDDGGDDDSEDDVPG